MQRGVNSSGPLMGETTGYPRCGTLSQARLILAGFRSAPSTMIFSRAGNPLDYLTTGNPLTADLAIVKTIDSDAVRTIYELFIGQHLQVFTSNGPMWFEGRSIDATQSLNLIPVPVDYGVARNVPVQAVQGSTLFVQAGGQIIGEDEKNTVVRDMVYSGQEAVNYQTEPLTLLGAHLLTNVQDFAHRAGVTTRDASILFFINADGLFAMMTLLKSQKSWRSRRA